MHSEKNKKNIKGAFWQREKIQCGNGIESQTKGQKKKKRTFSLESYAYIPLLCMHTFPGILCPYAITSYAYLSWNSMLICRHYFICISLQGKYPGVFFFALSTILFHAYIEFFLCQSASLNLFIYFFLICWDSVFFMLTFTNSSDDPTMYFQEEISYSHETPILEDFYHWTILFVVNGVVRLRKTKSLFENSSIGVCTEET